MQWLTPTTAIIAGAISVPLLVLLYFLKLKRQDEFVSSTFLWKQAVQDLQVNAPFQKLRRNLLLLLQLLAMLCVLCALAGPILSLTAGPGKRYVLLIDHSASMNATDSHDNNSKTTRLDEAKRQAKVLVNSMQSHVAFSLHDNADQAMIISFADRAKVLCNYTSDKRQLAAIIDSITPTDAKTKLYDAVTVARAFVQPSEKEQPQTGLPATSLELFSDGKIGDLQNIIVSRNELKFHCIGTKGQNVAVVAMQARRSYEKADEVSIFSTLANYGPTAINSDVQLSVDGNVRAIRNVTIPPRQLARKNTPGTVSVSFNLTHTNAGVFEVRQLKPDLLACDDAAWAVVAPPRKLKVLLVTNGNVPLRSALQACPLSKLDVKNPADFESMTSQFAGLQSYDAIVMDNYCPDKLPRGEYLIFGQWPGNLGVSPGGDIKNQPIVDWRTRHPVLQFVDFSNFFAAKTRKFKLPRDAEVLAEFSDSPAIALLHRNGGTFLLVGFNPMDTNWPFEPGFVMFCYNAINYRNVRADDPLDSLPG